MIKNNNEKLERKTFSFGIIFLWSIVILATAFSVYWIINSLYLKPSNEIHKAILRSERSERNRKTRIPVPHVFKELDDSSTEGIYERSCTPASCSTSEFGVPSSSSMMSIFSRAQQGDVASVATSLSYPSSVSTISSSTTQRFEIVKGNLNHNSFAPISYYHISRTETTTKMSASLYPDNNNVLIYKNYHQQEGMGGFNPKTKVNIDGVNSESSISLASSYVYIDNDKPAILTVEDYDEGTLSVDDKELITVARNEKESIENNDIEGKPKGKRSGVDNFLEDLAKITLQKKEQKQPGEEINNRGINNNDNEKPQELLDNYFGNEWKKLKNEGNSEIFNSKLAEGDNVGKDGRIAFEDIFPSSIEFKNSINSIHEKFVKINELNKKIDANNANKIKLAEQKSKDLFSLRSSFVIEKKGRRKTLDKEGDVLKAKKVTTLEKLKKEVTQLLVKINDFIPQLNNTYHDGWDRKISKKDDKHFFIESLCIYYYYLGLKLRSEFVYLKISPHYDNLFKEESRLSGKAGYFGLTKNSELYKLFSNLNSDISKGKFNSNKRLNRFTSLAKNTDQLAQSLAQSFAPL